MKFTATKRQIYRKSDSATNIFRGVPKKKYTEQISAYYVFVLVHIENAL